MITGNTAKKAKPVTTSGVHGGNAGTGQRGRPIFRSKLPRHPQMEVQHAAHRIPVKTASASDHRPTSDHNYRKDINGHQVDYSSSITEGECRMSETVTIRLLTNNLSPLLFLVCLLKAT